MDYYHYLCINMTSLDIIIISYKEKAFHAAFIPDIFTSEDQKLLIGSHSLNLALYDDDKGYIDEEAKIIDEQIYAFIDDEYFSLSSEEFIEKVKLFLD